MKEYIVGSLILFKAYSLIMEYIVGPLILFKVYSLIEVESLG